MLAMSRDVQEMWLALDHRLDDNGCIVDRFLERPDLGTPVRSFLQALAQTSMRLCEVATLVPGTSITLRDVITGSEVTVNERTASRTLSRHDWLAARVISCGCTGGPEIERGVLPIPIPCRDSVLRSIERHLKPIPWRELSGLKPSSRGWLAATHVTRVRPMRICMENTDIDVAGGGLRCPFPVFAHLATVIATPALAGGPRLRAACCGP